MANTRRENRLEELGRVDAEHADTAKGKRNLKDEKKRIRKELQDGGSPHTKDRKRSPKRKLITGYGSQGQSSKPVEEPRKIYQKGGKAKPWGHGPKPGSLEFFQHHTQGPKRKGKADGGAIAGAKAGAKKVVAPFTHTANAMKAGATKLIKGLPKIAKKGWK